MKRSFLIFIISGVISVAAMAGVFSANTQLQLSRWLNPTGAMLRLHKQALPSRVNAFITIDNEDAINHLRDNGVELHSRFGNVLTVTMALNDIDAIARNVAGVKHISLEQRCTLCNDSALRMSHFPYSFYMSDGIARNVYSGNGVLVGVIDVGTDFNHINFLDEQGNSRILRVYMPADATGSHPVIDGMELPGSEYVTPEQIRLLTTDDTHSGHGTHTTGTAAGSYMANGFNGVATRAQIVACSMPEDSLTDVNIANSVKYIFNYANQVGLPAVINMSIGSQEGSHDGSSFLCRLFDDVSGPGRICVVSAGNDGEKAMHIEKEMSDNDSLCTFLLNKSSSNVISGYSSMWSSGTLPHSADLVIWDVVADSLVHRLDFPHDAVLDSVYVVTSDADTVLGKYFDGEVAFASTLEDNDRFHSIVAPDYKCLDVQRYRLGIIYKAARGEVLSGWAGNTLYYDDCSLSSGSWLSGTARGSISDLATGDSTISVGAYCSTMSFRMKDGSVSNYNQGDGPGAIASYSSYGPDNRGKPRPMVVAPGCALVSSQNRYYSVYSRPKYQFDVVEVDGEQYPYGVGTGTSMSTPVVTGAIALMLEINPLLSPSEISSILESTSTRDAWVETDVERWGYGKLDIDSCIKQLLRYIDGDVNGDGVVSASDITNLYNIILGFDYKNIQRSDINVDGATSGSDVTKIYNMILGL